MAKISKRIFLLLLFSLNLCVFICAAQQNNKDKPASDSLNEIQPTNLQKSNTTSINYLVKKPLAQKQEEGRWIIGAGAAYDSYTQTPGLNVNLTSRILGNFHIGPDFSIMLNNELDDNGKKEIRKEFEFNFNAQQLFEIGKRWAIYPLTGINLSKITKHPVGQEAEGKWVTGLNLGGGFEFTLKKNKLFCEGKYVTYIQKWDITIGYLFIIPSK